MTSLNFLNIVCYKVKFGLQETLLANVVAKYRQLLKLHELIIYIYPLFLITAFAISFLANELLIANILLGSSASSTGVDSEQIYWIILLLFPVIYLKQIIDFCNTNNTHCFALMVQQFHHYQSWQSMFNTYSSFLIYIVFMFSMVVVYYFHRIEFGKSFWQKRSTTTSMEYDST